MWGKCPRKLPRQLRIPLKKNKKMERQFKSKHLDRGSGMGNFTIKALVSKTFFINV